MSGHRAEVKHSLKAIRGGLDDEAQWSKAVESERR
jgi:hypothetical protein